MIPIAITLSISLLLSILWADSIQKDTTTKEERDNTPFP